MKQDIAVRWVEELRSGKYKQGRLALKRVEDGAVTHCCLGVLCELFLDVGGWEVSGTSMVYEFIANGITNGGVPPPLVAELAGMASQSGALRSMKFLPFEGQTYQGLAEANDYGETFADIADFIESNYGDL